MNHNNKTSNSLRYSFFNECLNEWWRVNKLPMRSWLDRVIMVPVWHKCSLLDRKDWRDTYNMGGEL